jgi:hypothetical protein
MFRLLTKCVLATASLLAVHSGPGISQQESSAPLKVLIVGGGPDRKNNQVAIESNVRYVNKLLPFGSSSRVLFANGDPNSKNVLCEDDNNRPYYRIPNLPRLDGPSNFSAFKFEMNGLSQQAASTPSSPVLLYFTGHGGPDEPSGFQNNVYDMWAGNELSVHELAKALDSLPRETPVTVVMVECFSGAFGNLLFDGGNPAGGLVDRPICGFFASVPQRMAAGCTPEINEADYKDFTGYFFAALSGVDRMGRHINGADYRHDGHIGMDEAYAYALIHDDSIDTPVCTSDVFLRRFVTTPDRVVMATPYSHVRAWASAPQKAALDALSENLGLSGDFALHEAYNRFIHMDLDSEALEDTRLIRFVRLGKSIVLAHDLTTTASRETKARYEQLIRLEAGNPLKP